MSKQARIYSRSVSELIEMYNCGEITVGLTDGIGTYDKRKTLTSVVNHMIDYSFRFDTLLLIEVSENKYELVRESDVEYMILVVRFKNGLARIPKHTLEHHETPYDEIRGCSFSELPEDVRKRFNRHTVSVIQVSK